MTNLDDGLRQRILSGRSDANIRFDDLRLFLLRLGFAEPNRATTRDAPTPGDAGPNNGKRATTRVAPTVGDVRQVRQTVLRYRL